MKQEKPTDIEMISSHELLARLELEPEPRVTTLSGFPSLMKATNGFTEGELITVSGPTKTGKTLFCQTLTIEFAKQGLECVWFQYEVLPLWFLRSFPRELLPRFFMPKDIMKHDYNMFELGAKTAWAKHHCQIVFIDHLHFLLDMAKIRNPSLEIGAYVRKLKLFAITNKLTIFLVCHMTKTPPDEKIGYWRMRDSSFIAQESDTTFVLWREKEPDSDELGSRSVLSVEFHRRTGVAQRQIPLIKRYGLLHEMVDEPDGMRVPF